MIDEDQKMHQASIGLWSVDRHFCGGDAETFLVMYLVRTKLKMMLD